jgi:choline dehydrogenase-like flavoprotein
MAKSTRRTTKVLTMPRSTSATPMQSRSANPTDAEIARRAFELYCERGRQNGRDVEDWLQARARTTTGSKLHGGLIGTFWGLGYAEDCGTCRRHRLTVERDTPSVRAASSRDSPLTL